jgi:hypothetical protein
MQERSGAVSSLQLKVLRRVLDGVPHRKRFTSKVAPKVKTIFWLQ